MFISIDFEIDIYRFIVMSSIKKFTVVVNLGPLINQVTSVKPWSRGLRVLLSQVSLHKPQAVISPITIDQND